jgi:hypothetical protein
MKAEIKANPCNFFDSAQAETHTWSETTVMTLMGQPNS